MAEVSSNNYHFAGWVTRCDIPCSDGRTIMRDAFKHHDGDIVPLVWNHQHNDVNNVLGQVLLHNREGSVYGYGLFNDTESGQAAKKLVDHGDICSMSICANQLKHNSNRGVTHGTIREVSLVLAGANPGALIDTIMLHGEECEDEAIIYSGEDIVLCHSDEEIVETEMEHSEKENNTVAEETKKEKETENDDKTIQDVVDSMNDEQKTVMYYMIGQALENAEETAEHSEIEEGDDVMKHNVFDQEEVQKDATLTHSDMNAIIAMAKETGTSFKLAAKAYVSENETLAHGFVDGEEGLGALFPDHKLLNPGAPEMLKDFDNGWVMTAINKTKKSPYARVRTRYANAKAKELEADFRAKGYKKGNEKQLTDKIKIIGRKTEPTTIYVKDEMHRDDIIDIVDFDVVAYNWNFMKENLYETLALAMFVGDQRPEFLEDGSSLNLDKINEENIRPIWKDDEMYTIHYDVDIEGARAKLQGTNTSAYFGENYIYAEAMIEASLYSREKFKGSGTPDLYCTPHFVNVMLLARDLNGRRIYDSKADLARALNVNSIVEIEHFEGLTREDAKGNTKKLLGLIVNLSDYQFGSTKGGELTKFEDFDIDFNKYKYLLETRLSGALTKLESAIALEELVVDAAG